MEYDNILYRTEDRIAVITLNRPEKRNALSPALRKEVVAALKSAEQDDSVSVILIEGAGPAFCAGYDMSGTASGDPNPERPEGWNHSPLYESWTGQFPRSCLRDWLTIWDLMKPARSRRRHSPQMRPVASSAHLTTRPGGFRNRMPRY